MGRSGNPLGYHASKRRRTLNARSRSIDSPDHPAYQLNSLALQDPDPEPSPDEIVAALRESQGDHAPLQVILFDVLDMKFEAILGVNWLAYSFPRPQIDWSNYTVRIGHEILYGERADSKIPILSPLQFRRLVKGTDDPDQEICLPGRITKGVTSGSDGGSPHRTDPWSHPADEADLSNVVERARRIEEAAGRPAEARLYPPQSIAIWISRSAPSDRRIDGSVMRGQGLL